jgi:hypothetical protein
LSPNDPNQIGRITDVSAHHLIATLEVDYRERLSAQSDISVTHSGANLLVRSRGSQLLVRVIRSWLEGDQVRLHLVPVGELTSDGGFSRGVSRFPALEAPLYTVNANELDGMFDSFRRFGLHLGRHSQFEELKVYFDPNPLFGRHLAILGQSGAGKSWAVSSILQRTVSAMPRAHVVVLDIHGEYGWRDEKEQLHSAFPENMARHVDARALEIPYWLLTYSELIDLLIDRTDPNASLQMAFMREVLYTLRKKANQDLGIDSLSVDSPVYFPIKEMYLQFKKANEQQLDFGKTRGPLFGAFDEFLVRFQAMYNDSRYSFLFKPKNRTKSSQLESLLRDFIGLGDPKRPISVIDLSFVPHDVRPTITAQIARLAFEFNYWNPHRHEFPILLVCEEAHQYIPRDTERQHAATRREVERIAKEGRKYGVGLCVVSQRPLELSETVLAQCSNFLCLRITNPDDQAYVRRLMPEGEQDLTETLASLRRGEALAVGEAIPLPTRMQIYPPDPPPASQDAPVSEAWREGPEDLDIADIVQRWWRQRR